MNRNRICIILWFFHEYFVLIIHYFYHFSLDLKTLSIICFLGFYCRNIKLIGCGCWISAEGKTTAKEHCRTWYSYGLVNSWWCRWDFRQNAFLYLLLCYELIRHSSMGWPFALLHWSISRHLYFTIVTQVINFWISEFIDEFFSQCFFLLCYQHFLQEIRKHR